MAGNYEKYLKIGLYFAYIKRKHCELHGWKSLDGP